MKKFLFLTFLALMGAVAPAMAQLTVTCEGKEVKDGDVLTFYASETVDDYGTLAVTAGPASEPFFKTKTACNLKVEVKTTVNAADGVLYWCGVTTKCSYISGGSQVRETELKPFPPAPMKLHAEFEQNKYETYEAYVTVFVDGEKTMSFTEKFVYDKEHAAGIENTTAQQSVKFNGTSLDYNFTSAAPRLVQIFGMDGKLAEQHTLNAQKGSVRMNGLQMGAYIYSVFEAGKQIDHGKVIVK